MAPDGEGFGLPVALPTPLPRLPLAALLKDCTPPACREPLLPPMFALLPPPVVVLQLFGCQLFGSSVLTPPLLLATALLAGPAAAEPTGKPLALPATDGPAEAARLGAAEAARLGPAEAAPAPPPGTGMSSTLAARSAAKPAAATCTAHAKAKQGGDGMAPPAIMQQAGRQRSPTARTVTASATERAGG